MSSINAPASAAGANSAASRDKVASVVLDVDSANEPREPGASWRSKQAIEEHQRAHDMAVDREFPAWLHQFGDVLDDKARLQGSL